MGNWSFDVDFKAWIVFAVCEIVVRFWGVVVYMNEIDDVWGVSMAKGKLKVEERRGGRIQM